MIALQVSCDFGFVFAEISAIGVDFEVEAIFTPTTSLAKITIVIFEVVNA